MAPAGGTWQADLGSLSNFAVAEGSAQATVSSSDTQLVSLPLSSNFDVSARAGFAGAVATTRVLLAGRVVPGVSRYVAGLVLTAKSGVQLQIERRTAGGVTALGGSFTIQQKPQADARYLIRFQGIGTALRAKAWTVGSPEPGWQLNTTDASLTTGTRVGFGGSSGSPGGGAVIVDDFLAVDPASASDFANCSGTVSYSSLSLGGHVFTAHVATSKEQQQAIYPWTISAPAPTLTITQQPTNPSTNLEASFAWTTTGVVDSTLCTLDGAAGACASPRTFSALALGSHRFTVTVANGSGSDSETVDWTISPPAPTVLLFPSGPAPGADATFAWQTTGVVDSTTCTLDGVTNPCTSPKPYFGLTPGLHTLTVTVSNGSGSDDARSAFTVDPAPPTVALTSQPSDPTGETSASFGWTTTGSVDSTTCALDGVPNACSSPRSYTGLAPVPHSFTVTVEQRRRLGQRHCRLDDPHRRQ